MSANKPSARPVRLSAAAVEDVKQAIAAARNANAFIDALQLALAQASHASAADASAAWQLSLPGLRTQALRGQAHQVFYLELPQHIRVLRVLRAAQI